ncbi:MAG: NUDIX domain-containing protein, partial [Patescibacteria group bacterium]
MDKFPKIGVNVFVLKDGKLLLGKRIGKTGYGTWCLPGGHFEWGESLAGAAARELEEETSIKSNDLQYLHLVNEPRLDNHYVNIELLAKNW